MNKNERYKIVPTTLRENLLFRRDLFMRCHRDHGFRQQIMDVWKEDCVFFFNTACIAAGTLVVTDRGYVPIEQVTSRDLVWDGDCWVKQEGAVFKGRKSVMFQYGIKLTDDHLVRTKHGWQPASFRYDRQEVRMPDGYSQRRNLQRHEASRLEVPMRLRGSYSCLRQQSSQGINEQLWMLERGEGYSRRFRSSGLSNMDGHEGSMLQSKEQVLSSLRRKGYHSLQAMDEVRVLSCRHGRATRRNDDRAQEQQWKLRTEELLLGHQEGSSQQSQSQGIEGDYRNFIGNHQRQASSRNGWSHDSDYSLSTEYWHDWGFSDSASETRESQAEVYDLVNCGPNQCFTVIDSNGDPLLVHNCWVFEPRVRLDAEGNELPKVIPFIAWEHQVPAIHTIIEHLGKRDIGVEKSRSEGMSWLAVLITMHQWKFKPMTNVGIVSKDAMTVDNPQNPDSFFWKLDTTLKMWPKWLGGEANRDWKRNITNSTLLNLQNGSAINGFASTEDVASGGRATFFVMDELAKFPQPSDQAAMASTQYVTDCRLFISTPKGASGAYYDLMHSDTNLIKVVLDWQDNPTRNRGLYSMVNGKPVAVDPKNNPLPPHYDPPTEAVLDLFNRLRRKAFKLDDPEKHRSPWYDNECDRPGATPQNVAQELDRDYGGSGHRYFGDTFRAKVEAMLLPPVMQGDFDFGKDSLDDFRFIENPGGPLKLWMPLDSLGRPLHGKYAAGCDIAAGTGGSFSSNSVLFAVKLPEGEQVLEYAANTILPADFADLAIAMCRWLNNAYLGWEANGPGQTFTNQIVLRGYSNVYHRRELSVRSRKTTKKLGWWTDEKSKEVMFSSMQSAVTLNNLVVRSTEFAKESGHYVYKAGRITNALIKNAVDDAQGATHGDRVIAGAVCVQVAKDRPFGHDIEDEGQEAPEGTAERRMQEYEEEQRRDADPWDDDIFDRISKVSRGY